MSDEAKKSIQQNVLRKVKGFADIVFVLDRSGSMTDCLDTVKNNIGDFINSLSANQQISAVDWRIGFVAFDEADYYIFDFSKDKETFRKSLATVLPGGTELTLPAIDVALDFSWREEAQRIIILFTDEPLVGGEHVDLQRSKIEDLKQKITGLGAKFYYYGEYCPDYWEFNKIPGALMIEMDLHSKTPDKEEYKKILIQMGKTISNSLSQRAQKMKNVVRDIFNVGSLVQVHRI
jgi:hypothetical protein